MSTTQPYVRRPHARSRVAVVVMTALVVLAAACGSGSSGGSAGGPNSSTVSPSDLPECPLAALDAATGPVQVTLWHFLSGKTGDTLKALVDTYNASQTKVKVVVESQGTSNDELFRKYQAGIKNNDLPAIAVMDDTVTQQVIDSKTVLPAQSCIDADHVDPNAFLQSGRDYYTVNGVLWPASVNLSARAALLQPGPLPEGGTRPGHDPEDARRGPPVRAEDQGRRGGRQAGGPEGQLAHDRDVADRRR